MEEEKKKKNNWGDILFSLDEAESADFGQTEKKPDEVIPKKTSEAEPVREEESAVAETSVEEGKKVVKRGTRRAGSAKKTKASSSAKTEKKREATPRLDLFDDSQQARIDLTIGAPEKEPAEKRPRRGKKTVISEAELIRKAEEEEAAIIRKKKADVLLEQASLPFRNIAAQINEIVEERTEETKTGKPSRRRKSVKTERKSEKAEVSAVSPPKAAVSDDDFFGNFEMETLDVSWGRAPKTAKEEPMTAASSGDTQATVETEAERSKISKDDAENLFAENFSLASDDSAEKSESSPAAKAKTNDPESDDFWDIPEEPEIQFSSSRRKTTSEPAVSASSAAPKPVGQTAEESAVSSPRSERNRSPREDRGGRDRNDRDRARRSDSTDRPRENRRFGEERVEENRREPERSENRSFGRDRREPSENRSEGFERPVREDRDGRNNRPSIAASGEKTNEDSRRVRGRRRGETLKDGDSERRFADAEPLRNEQGSADSPRRDRREERDFGEDDFEGRSDRRPSRLGDSRPEVSTARPDSDQPVERSPRGDWNRNPADQPAPEIEESRPSAEGASRGYPSWQEAISQVIGFNIGRHSQRPKDGHRRR